jgi:hypothetical protein
MAACGPGFLSHRSKNEKKESIARELSGKYANKGGVEKMRNMRTFEQQPVCVVTLCNITESEVRFLCLRYSLLAFHLIRSTQQ